MVTNNNGFSPRQSTIVLKQYTFLYYNNTLSRYWLGKMNEIVQLSQKHTNAMCNTSVLPFVISKLSQMPH